MSGAYIHILAPATRLQSYDASGGLLPFWVIGTPFMRAFYTIYDVPSATVHVGTAVASR